MIYEYLIPVGLGECLCSEDIAVKQVPVCHTLTGKHTPTRLLSRLPLCYGNLLCAPKQLYFIRQNTESGWFNRESSLKHLVGPNTAAGNLLYLGKDRLLRSPKKFIFMWERKSRALPVQAGRMERFCSQWHRGFFLFEEK